MNRVFDLRAIALVFVWLSFAASAQPGNDRPNIIFIVADDMGAWSLGAYDRANTYTPVIDKLASEGALFRNLFSSSAVCSPSRAAMMSGRYPSETGVTDVLLRGHDHGMDLSLKPFPEVLQSNGYSTALVGKWHVGDNEEYLPQHRGYDRFAGFPVGAKRSQSPSIYVNGEWKEAEGKYTSDLLADYAIDYIRDMNPTRTGKPFLLSLHFWAPHANSDFPSGKKLDYGQRSWLPMKDVDTKRWEDMDIRLPEPDFPNLDIPKVTRMAREYYSSVHSVDRNVGRLMDYLEKSGLSENTIVIFTSDHGYMMGHHGLWHKGNGGWLTKDGKDPAGLYGAERTNLYNHSLRIPFIIRWPRVIRPGIEVPGFVSDVDIYPSILEMTRTEKPADLVLRGRSIYSLLTGKRGSQARKYHYAEYKFLRAFVTPDWKIVMDFSKNERHELYHISTDPGEMENLFHSKDRKVIKKKKELQSLLYAKMKEIKDPLLAGENKK